MWYRVRMQKRHIITIGGRPGSGKSTTARKVAEKLGYERFSSGDFMRAIAKDRGVTIEELNVIAETEPAIDKEVDGKLRTFEKAGDNLVIDSRLAFHWIPDSFKVYLNISRDEAIRRIYSDTAKSRVETSEALKSPEDALEAVEKRLASERKRYRELYDVDPYDPKHFDLVIDTGDNNIENVIETIVSSYNKWLIS